VLSVAPGLIALLSPSLGQRVAESVHLHHFRAAFPAYSERFWKHFKQSDFRILLTVDETSPSGPNAELNG